MPVASEIFLRINTRKVLSRDIAIDWIMAIGLADIYEKLKELITVVDKVRENTEAISELKRNQEEMQANILKIIDGQQRILERLEFREELASLKVQMAEHIACEKARA